MLIRSFMALTWVICAYKFGDWKNWRKYYPTMLFFGMGDLIYISVFHDRPLWMFSTDFLVPSLNELFVIFTIFFSTTLIFLSRYPDKLSSQLKYNTFWILLYIGIELATGAIGMIESHNGWNIKWSILHDTIQFPLIALHHKRPVLAWTIALVFLVLIMKTFGVPFIVTK